MKSQETNDTVARLTELQRQRAVDSHRAAYTRIPELRRGGISRCAEFCRRAELSALLDSEASIQIIIFIPMVLTEVCRGHRYFMCLRAYLKCQSIHCLDAFVTGGHQDRVHL